AHHMWQGDRSAFDGAHVHAEMPISNPQPLSQPHPPILIGGMGERKTLRLAAQYADAINFFGRAGAETLTQKLGVLREHCDTLGRDFDAIEKTTLNTVHLAPGEMSVADVIATFKEQASLGFTHAIVNMPNVHEITPVETMVKEVIPAVADL
ncbi:MAG: LLM class flavin-dependent oxidoreductase, partial [Anaerolineae bacterium]|nr:LLM class flavin-dependent oxidoreductase [Anaerolineae bacterium]